jgi:SAM-dependent methyltransferase
MISVLLPPGGAIRRLADALTGCAVIGDIYHEGAVTYESLVDHGDGEVRAIVNQCRGRRGDVLDLGCGGGRLTLPFLTRGNRVVAIDRSAAMLDQLKARASRLPGRLLDRLETRLTDMSTIALPGRRFEVVVLGATTVTLLDEPTRARTFQAVRRHLAPAGRFLISTVWYDRPPADGPPPETAQVVTVAGEHGTTIVTILQQVADDLTHRWVGVLVAGPVGEPLRPCLFITRPGHLSASTLRDELATAGLHVVHTDSLSADPDGRRCVLLTCSAQPEGETP